MKQQTKAKIINYGWLVGWIIAISKGYSLHYFFGTMILGTILYHKQLWHIMKMGGEMYADYCESMIKKIRERKDKK